MGKILLAVFFFFLFSACWELSEENWDSPADHWNAFPTVIQNNKLPAHKNIPGTRVFLVPPKDFKISSGFTGLQRGVTTIEVTDVSGVSFYRSTETFSRELIEAAGHRVLEFQELTVNGFPGKMALIDLKPAARSYSLAFGDSSFSVFMSARFNGVDSATGEQLRQAFASVYYEKGKVVSMYVPAIFTLNDSKSIFKYAKTEGDARIYSLNGVVKDSYGAGPYVMVGNVPASNADLEEMANELLLIRGNYNTGSTLESMTGGYPSLTREVFGKLAGKEVFIYQHLVLMDETVVCMQGVADADDFEGYLEEFKKLTNTVGKKERSRSPVPVKIKKTR